MAAGKLETEKLPIAGALLIRPMRSEDSRGAFYKLCTEELLKANGASPHFVEHYVSVSRKGVVRGLHYQAGALSQAKLVQCVQGKVYDVILDMRKASPSFGKWAGVELGGADMRSLFIPRGVAHGFATLSDEATMFYSVDNVYSKEHERGVLWNDPALKIEWRVQKPIVSERDLALPPFKDAEYF